MREIPIIINKAMKLAETTVTFQPIQLMSPVVKSADKQAEIRGIATHLNCLKIRERIKTERSVRKYVYIYIYIYTYIRRGRCESLCFYARIFFSISLSFQYILNTISLSRKRKQMSTLEENIGKGI